MVDRDALAREMGEQLKRLMYDLGNGNPWSLANFMSEIAMRHIAAARAEEHRAEIARLRAALSDMLSGWRYIRTHHGDLSGVGWGRCEDAASAALKPPA
jgi:hypothetical protein